MKKLFCLILLLLLLTANVGQSQLLPSDKPMFGQLLNLGHWSTDGLVGYWPFVQASNLVDFSYYSNDGTISGATWEGGALDFDGGDDFTETTGIVPVGDTYTFLWSHRVDSLTNERQPFGLNNASQFYQANGSGILIQNVGTDVVCTIADVVGEWVTYAYVGSPTQRTFYRNGIFNISRAEAAYDYGLTQTLQIGRRHALVNWWNGAFKYFAVYNRALSASEIAELYRNPNLPMQQEPIWMFYSPAVGMDIGALMRAVREDKTGGKQTKSGGKQ